MRRLLGDAAIASGSHFGAALMQLLLQIVAARTLGVAGFGVYGAIVAVATTIEVIFVTRSGELALQLIGRAWVHEDLVRVRATARRLVRRDAVIYAVVFAAALIAALPLARVLHVPAGLLALMCLLVPTQIGYGVTKGLFIATGRVRAQATFELAFAAAQLGLGVAGVYGFGIRGLIVSQVLASLCKSLIAWRVTRRWWAPANRAPADEVKRVAEEVKREDWTGPELHSVARNVLQYGASQLDTIILAALTGGTTVGIYRAAKTLSGLPARAAGPVWAAIRPRLLRAIHERQQARLRRLIMLPAAAMLAAGVVALPFALLWGEALVSRVYGPGFADATRPLLLLLAGTWTFGAVTAWFPFWVIITERRADGARTYSLLFALTVGTALAFGHRSAAYMALAVGSSLVVSAAVAWGAFLRATSAPRSVAPVAEAEAGRAG